MMIELALVGYLVGSVPIAWLSAKIVNGRDLRQMGSGNVGVLNTALSVRRWNGLIVFAAEAAKGILVAALARTLDGSEPAGGLTALAAISGTRWPIWLHGRGGRGNTAAIGALAVISPPTLVLMLGEYLGARVPNRTSFLAMRVTLLLLPLTIGLVTQSWWMG
jgi:glycerol-3-phosphate acyltransferase PlsY